ncbi:ornithine decarboxylase-like [Anoplopoma fimbria]|uniref:ornithine decarboxylase-like n=1 Tax=Anoplopoma fimbria TaxID=229290 RepID=UPI0023EC6E04|nr:ornithine decarboxylase-like [Anoplopoma fimbria]
MFKQIDTGSSCATNITDWSVASLQRALKERIIPFHRTDNKHRPSYYSTSCSQPADDLTTQHNTEAQPTAPAFVQGQEGGEGQGIEEPFYVANLDSIFEMNLRWRTNLPRVRPFYAVKCNNDAAVLRMMSALDIGFDCASKGEIQLVLSLGVTPDKIIYAHTTKPVSHIKYACTHGVDTMTFDNLDELLKISLCHAKAKLVLRIAVDPS